MDAITHTGIVEYTKGTQAHVRILQESACAGCHARQMCMSADMKEKWMDCEMLTPMQAGDKVIVEISESMGWQAVVIGYVLPFVVLVAGVTVGVEMGWGEAIAALGSMAVLAVYYFCVWLCRDKIAKSFAFRARKIN